MPDDEEENKPAQDVHGEAFLRAVARAPGLPPPRSDEAMVGTRIAHFVVRRTLGRGGMGVVYEAEDAALGRLVALKVLLPGRNDDEARRRFLREARTASKVAHPNVGTIYEVGESDEGVYIAMELVRGPTLRQWLASNPALADRLRAARDIAAGVAVAHQAAIVHRDLKPDNVMLTEDGIIKVLDFGLAKVPTGLGALEETMTDPERLLGTPLYMAPEQAMGKETDARTDVFALGTVLYEAVTGEVPFRRETIVETLAAIVRDRAPPANELNPLVSADLARVISRCLAKAPADRYSTAGALAEALSASLALSISGVSGSRDPLGRGVARPSRGRRWWGWFAGGGLAVLAIVTLASRFSSRRAEGPSRTLAPPPGDAPLAITEHPPPATENREAARLYARALQSIRDGSGYVAIEELERAVSLDPSFAAARLRLLFFAQFSPPSGVEGASKHYQAASETRASLSERDQALLGVFRAEATSGVRPDMARMDEVASRYPGDAEVAFLAAVTALGAGRPDKTEIWAQRALAIDPRFAAASWMHVVVEFVIGDMPATVEAANRCLEISPTAASCLRNRMITHAILGECGAMEEDARRGTVLEPESSRALLFLARAIAATGGTEEAIREALTRRWAATPARLRRATELADQAMLEATFGDFTHAEADFDALGGVPLSEATEEPAAVRAWQLLNLYRETGDDARALATAKQELAARASYVSRLPEIDALAISTAERGGAITPAEAEALRADASFRGFAWPPVFLWAIRDAYAVETPEEARRAISAMPEAAPLDLAGVARDVDHHYDPIEGAIGKALLLAGRPQAALPLLDRYARSCLILASPFEWVRTQYFDGLAREANGDAAGACAAYGRLLGRWGAATPRSVMAEKARARAAALRCGG